jgi:hypothetical protein
LIMNLLCLCSLCYCRLSSCPIHTFPKIFFAHVVLTCPWMYLHHVTKDSACVTPHYCICGSCNHVHHNSCILTCFCSHPISRMYYSCITILVFKQNTLLALLIIFLGFLNTVGRHQLFIVCNINCLHLTDKIVWCLHTWSFCVCCDNYFSSVRNLNKAVITHSSGTFANLWKVTVSFVVSCLCPSILPSVQMEQPPPDGFSLNLMFQ